MKKRPKGRKYRNLFARGSAIYYERKVHGRRYVFSTKTSDWDEAAAVRDLWEERKGIASGMAPRTVPTFGELADRYLECELADASDRYRRDHLRLLGKPNERQGMTPRSYFDRTPVDEIGPRALDAYVRAQGFAWRTAKAHLVAISQVLKLAIIGEHVAHNAAREYVDARSRRQKGTELEPNPIHDPEALGRFVAASEARGGVHHVATLIALDAGLRPGEIRGLRWEDWTRAGERPSLHVTRSVSSTGAVEKPKTRQGRRRVHLSRRLQRALAAWRLRLGNPDSGEILPGWRDRAYRRHFDACMKAAGIGGHTPYDLRKTYASILFSLHVPERYVVRQMGHADFATTTRHYAKFIADEDDMGIPPQLAEGECWADLISRWESQQSPNTAESAAS